MQITMAGFVVGTHPAGMAVFRHLPPAQKGAVVGHTFPHDPQLALSLNVLAQKGAPPSPGVQSDWFAAHCDVHAPFEHPWRTPEHAVPHVPQLALSVWRLAQ